MGRDDGQPVAHLAGGGPPAQFWRAFMIAALPRAGAGPIPAGPAPTATVPAAPALAPATEAAPVQPPPVNAPIPEDPPY